MTSDSIVLVPPDLHLRRVEREHEIEHIKVLI
jgi:hypothetical protein